ncbi:phosphatidate cytidylyltransferase [Pseudaeromonas sharmana]|uniref:Phosphatidate cytidylyltransferase n=1 Tax=Pseudaeromonas sharmana TaxID=328412 RepID=A0ABV8CSJ9_9GAMM
MLKQRLLTALILIPLAVGWMFFLPFDYFTLGAVLICLLASREWGRFVWPEQPSWLALPMGGVLAVTLFLAPTSHLLSMSIPVWVEGILVAGALWWLFAVWMVVRYPRSASCWRTSRWLKAGFGLLTLLPFFWAMLLLRSYQYAQDTQYGGWALFFVMLLVWCADSGAYFCGRALGRHKLMPAVSPKKTIEGLLGGLVLATAVAAITAYGFLTADENRLAVIVSAVLAVLASVLGDLAESLFKREAGLKDSGSLLPGHGGVLDRIDSLTAALPVFVISYLLLS